ncbi:hypothetical protein OGAPHI_006716 [Ogataea philodendri]|uniref:Uncharacterized protein n=1 Tax=Ogataea philodendri TaxID=1378263 RepID=A0A9P8T0L6_9ASCO|nr:uncharacterized protein OGAPHI_006716 [Ogataea philodendri]KAH3661309.1 hypothetical protein OGAPHI_006716 [Ogataea philodendri]
MAGHLAPMQTARQQLAALFGAQMHCLDGHLVGGSSGVNNVLPDALESLAFSHGSNGLVLAADLETSVATTAHQGLALVVALGNVALLCQFAGDGVLGVVAAALGVDCGKARRTLAFVAWPVACVTALERLTADLAACGDRVETRGSGGGQLLETVFAAGTVCEQFRRPRALVARQGLDVAEVRAPVVAAVEKIVADLVTLERPDPRGVGSLRLFWGTFMTFEFCCVTATETAGGNWFFTGPAKSRVTVALTLMQITRHNVFTRTATRPPGFVRSDDAGKLLLGGSAVALDYRPHGCAFLDVGARMAGKRASVNTIW